VACYIFILWFLKKLVDTSVFNACAKNNFNSVLKNVKTPVF